MSNSAFMRDSEATNETINGNEYYEVAKAYYTSRMYEDSMYVLEDVSDIAKVPIFNPVEKIVNISSSLTTMGKLEPIVDNADEIKLRLTQLGLDTVKFSMTRDLILGKSVMAELQATLNTESPYVLSYYTKDNYEVKSIGNTIYQCVLNGQTLVYDKETNEYSVSDVERKYIRQENGTAVLTITIGEEVTTETFPIMPLVELVTPYDLKQLFYCIDRYNQLDSFIANIFSFAGEPKLTATGVSQLSEVDIQNIQNDRYKKLQTFFTKNENAKIAFIETSGKACSSILEKQNEIKENVIKLFPEYAISNSLDGGNVGFETTKIRLTEVLSRIESLRETYEQGINDILGIYDILTSSDRKLRYVKLTDMMDIDIKNTVDSVNVALQNGIISKQSAMNSIKDLFIGKDVLLEIERIKTESSGALNKLFGGRK